MITTVLFDLDGTITESGMGITRSVAYALEKNGILETDQKKLDTFVGPPLIDSFMRLYGFSLEQAKEAVEQYREYYAVKGIFENRVYDGVEQMLQTLHQKGKRCILATSKPEHYAVQILEYFGLDRWFDVVAGASMDETRTAKDEVIAYALNKAGLKDLSQVIMVGDRKHDIQGAAVNGLQAIGVLYGYGSREELEQAGAAYLAETPMDIVKYV